MSKWYTGKTEFNLDELEEDSQLNEKQLSWAQQVVEKFKHIIPVYCHNRKGEKTVEVKFRVEARLLGMVEEVVERSRLKNGIKVIKTQNNGYRAAFNNGVTLLYYQHLLESNNELFKILADEELISVQEDHICDNFMRIIAKKWERCVQNRIKIRAFDEEVKNALDKVPIRIHKTLKQKVQQLKAGESVINLYTTYRQGGAR